MFEKGQKVVCINADPRFGNEGTWGVRFDIGLDGLTKGAIYTVRRVSGDSLWVEEITRRHPVVFPDGREYHRDGPFWTDRFRPLKKTSIEIFEAILKKASAPSEQKVE